MPYHLNLNGVEPASTGDFTVLPDAWYDVRIIEAKETTSSQKGTPGIELRFRVVSEAQLGSTFKDTIWISANPTALGFLRQKLEAMGYPIPAGDFYLNPQELVGRTVSVQTKQRKGDTATFMDVAAYDKVSDSGLPTAPGADGPPAPPAEDWRADAPPAPAAEPQPVAAPAAQTEEFPF